MSNAAPEPKENMGAPAPRIDARLKVTGQARYPADIPVGNVAHAVLVTSPIARGKAGAVSVDAAKAVPGVLDIMTYGAMDHLEKPKFGGGGSTSIGPLHDRTIHHDGQIVALVVADSFEAAREAAGLVRVGYTQEEPSAGFGSKGSEELSAVGHAQSHKEDPKVGDFEAAWSSAPTKMEADYSTPTQHHNPIELFSTTCAWEDGKLTVWEPSQNVVGHAREIARQMKLPPENVRVISQYIGGAFGSKGPLTPRTAIIAEAARRLNRPVRCVVTRQQGFTVATYRAETRHRIRIGSDAEGRITAFSHEGWELTSRPDDYAVGGTSTTARMYGYGNVATKVNLVKADRNTPGYMRSPPETPYMFALESAMDEAALAAGLDPVEFRRINDTDKDPISGKPYTTRSLMACYDAAAEAFRWKERKTEPGSMRDGDWLIGWGCATATYPTHMGPTTARVRLTSDGKVRVQSASHEIGTGIRTVAAQMAAEKLGVPLEAVEVEMGDSALPPAPVSGGSISTASVCSAVMKACEAIRDRLAKAASGKPDGPLAGRDPAGLSLTADGIGVPGGPTMPLAEAFAAAGTGAIEEYAEWAPDGAPPDAIAKLYAGQGQPSGGGSEGPKLMYAFGAEFVEVRINARTREVRVPRIVGASPLAGS